MKDRIKDLRKELDLTQKEFADSIDLKRSGVGNIESGITILTDRNIKRICEKHNVNECWLKTGIGDMFNKISENDEFDILVGRLYAENDSFKKNIIKAMLTLNDQDWLVIKKFVKELKKV